MTQLKWLKVWLAGLLALSLVAGFIWSAAADISGTDIYISSAGGAAPDVALSSSGQFLAVAYYKQESGGNSSVYIKSSTAAVGWLTSTFLGIGSSPKLAFGSSNVVYVTWASSDGKSIETAACTLATNTPPACAPGTDPQTTTLDALDFPDIVVDGSGFIHVVWENNGAIQSARSSSANSLSGWSTIATVAGGGTDQKPVLARSGSNLHLAFLRGNLITPTQVQYRRSGTDGSPHSWGTAASFVLDDSNIISTGVHDKLDNPSIAASGSNVFLAWDAHRVSSNNFSLMQATSNSSGDSGSWSSPTYAPSGDLTTAALDATETKASSSSGVPSQETGLRPGLAISSTTAAIVWQQFPGECSTDFLPATVHFATPLIGAVFDILANNDTDVMVDAELVVASGGVRHFVFMKDDNTDRDCAGGVAGDYRVVYRGPFTVQINDGGEGGGVFLPLIRK